MHFLQGGASDVVSLPPADVFARARDRAEAARMQAEIKNTASPLSELYRSVCAAFGGGAPAAAAPAPAAPAAAPAAGEPGGPCLPVDPQCRDRSQCIRGICPIAGGGGGYGGGGGGGYGGRGPGGGGYGGGGGAYGGGGGAVESICDILEAGGSVPRDATAWAAALEADVLYQNEAPGHNLAVCQQIRSRVVKIDWTTAYDKNTLDTDNLYGFRLASHSMYLRFVPETRLREIERADASDMYQRGQVGGVDGYRLKD
jgi:hypothetical protein